MEKVKITQKQANEIERIKREGIPVTWRTDGWHINRGEELHDISFHLYTRALFVGYEVKPKFKEGDYVVNRLGSVGKVAKVDGDFLYGEWLYGDGYSAQEYPISMSINCTNSVWHATPEQIEQVATEKRRRWWKKHDREPWELREFDELRDKRNDRRYTVSEDIRDTGLSLLDTYINYERVGWDEIKDNFLIVCFAEDRKDL